MKRIFGVKKEKAPPPSLDEASGRLSQRGDVYVNICRIIVSFLFFFFGGGENRMFLLFLKKGSGQM